MAAGAGRNVRGEHISCGRGDPMPRTVAGARGAVGVPRTGAGATPGQPVELSTGGHYCSPGEVCQRGKFSEVSPVAFPAAPDTRPHRFPPARFRAGNPLCYPGSAPRQPRSGNGVKRGFSPGGAIPGKTVGIVRPAHDSNGRNCAQRMKQHPRPLFSPGSPGSTSPRV